MPEGVVYMLWCKNPPRYPKIKAGNRQLLIPPLVLEIEAAIPGRPTPDARNSMCGVDRNKSKHTLIIKPGYLEIDVFTNNIRDNRALSSQNIC